MTTDDTRDRRIRTVRPLLAPAELREELPLSGLPHDVVVRGREEVVRILDAGRCVGNGSGRRGGDDRLLVIVGPCSIHDPVAAIDYATRLASLASSVSNELQIVMRVYFEKPRTTIGWKGLINDPGLDGSFAVNDGLRMARSLILQILELGVPVGCEFLDPITPQYLADTVSWGAVGARTAHSQIHRQLCSGLSMPVGIKNPPDGDVQAAVDAVFAAASSHVFPGIDDGGRAALFTTTGNADCHVVLRGGTDGPNFDVASVDDVLRRLSAAGLPGRVIVDASHANSGKEHSRQLVVVDELADRLSAGDRRVSGVMIESFLEAGRQDLSLSAPGAPDTRSHLRYGQSVTDECIGWDATVSALSTLANAVRSARRSVGGVELVSPLGLEQTG